MNTEPMCGLFIPIVQRDPLLEHVDDSIACASIAPVLPAGRTVCKLHLPPPGLHVDMNGDGVMDHIQAHGTPPTPYTLHPQPYTRSPLTEPLSPPSWHCTLFQMA